MPRLRSLTMKKSGAVKEKAGQSKAINSEVNDAAEEKKSIARGFRDPARGCERETFGGDRRGLCRKAADDNQEGKVTVESETFDDAVDT